MKKVMVAAVAAMVLISGASALDNSLVNVQVGAGFASVGDSNAGVAGSLRISSKDQGSLLKWAVDGEASVYNTEAVAKGYYGPIYLGIGYASVDTIKSTGGDCRPEFMVNGQCPGDAPAADFTPKVTSGVSKSGAIGEVGLGQTFEIGDAKLRAEAGYRTGAIKGPIVALGLSTKVDGGKKEVGAKVNYESMDTNGQKINKVGVFGTLAF